MRPSASLLLTALLFGCGGGSSDAGRDGAFPAPDRPVAHIVSAGWSTEEARDRLNEFSQVVSLAGITRGMTVADIGAGEGYYTVRLVPLVGHDGRVLAEDIVPSVTEGLAQRIARQRLENVSVRLGDADDPKLPDASFDRVMMVHMYHEIAQPYAFLWHVRPSLKPNGLVVVVDANRPTQSHGTPPALLKCEFAAVGYTLHSFHNLPAAGGYLATFDPVGPRPDPSAIRACRLGSTGSAG